MFFWYAYFMTLSFFYFPGGLPSNLKSLSMQVLRNSECKNYWTSNNILDGHICIFQGSGYGACNVSNVHPYMGTD